VFYFRNRLEFVVIFYVMIRKPRYVLSLQIWF